MVHYPKRLGVRQRPLTTRDPTFANEENRPASARSLQMASMAEVPLKSHSRPCLMTIGSTRKRTFTRPLDHFIGAGEERLRGAASGSAADSGLPGHQGLAGNERECLAVVAHPAHVR
jgi:hypothetical protein